MGARILDYFLAFFIIIFANDALLSNPPDNEKHRQFQDSPTIENYVVYYSGNNLQAISRFDLAIIDPDQHTAQDVKELSEAGTLTIAYLNLGEVESYRHYFQKISPQWIIGINQKWKSHYYIDVNESGWQKLILDDIVPRIFKKGFNGLFFDMVDVAHPKKFPTTKPGIVKIIHSLRLRYPEKYFILNNGLFLGDDVFKNVDAILVESLFVNFDFRTHRYVKTNEKFSESKCKALRTIQRKYQMKIFTLDYVANADDSLVRYIYKRSLANDFLPYVSTIKLDSIFQIGW